MIKGKGKGSSATRPGPYTRSEESAGQPDEGRMVYVGRVPRGVEWQELKDHMKQAGEVEFAQVLTDDWGQARGVGFIRYKTEQEAQLAITTLNGTTMAGQEGEQALEVDIWTGQKPRTSKGKGGAMSWKGAVMGMMAGKGDWSPLAWAGGKSNFFGVQSGGCGKRAGHNKSLKVWVGSLPEGANWQELKDHFKQAGSVEFCNCRGRTGEVRFATVEEAQAAIDMLNGTEFMGATIEVDKWN